MALLAEGRRLGPRRPYRSAEPQLFTVMANLMGVAVHLLWDLFIPSEQKGQRRLFMDADAE